MAERQQSGRAPHGHKTEQTLAVYATGAEHYHPLRPTAGNGARTVAGMDSAITRCALSGPRLCTLCVVPLAKTGPCTSPCSRSTPSCPGRMTRARMPRNRPDDNHARLESGKPWHATARASESMQRVDAAGEWRTRDRHTSKREDTEKAERIRTTRVEHLVAGFAPPHSLEEAAREERTLPPRTSYQSGQSGVARARESVTN